MNRLALLASLWIAGIACGGATAVDETRSSSTGGRSDHTITGTVASDASGGEKSGTSQFESGGTLSSGGASSTPSSTLARDCTHPGNDGGGGAHTIAFAACCECGWPTDGPLCTSVLNILPYWHSADDPLYYACIGGEVPFCVMDHLDTCASGFPPECDDVFANQVVCISRLP